MNPPITSWFARRPRAAALAAACAVSLAATPAAAQRRAAVDCFEPAGAAPHARGRSVTLARALTLSRACRYGLTPDRIDQPPPARALHTDIAALAAALHAAAPAGAPPLGRLPTVYACPASEVEGNRCREGTQQAAWLDTCTESAFLDPANFRVQQTPGGFSVRHAASGARCDAGGTVLWFVPAPGDNAPPATFLRRPAEARVLPAGAGELTLPTHDAGGRETAWRVYAAHDEGGEGYYVGALAPGQPLTPLQRFFAQHQADPPGAPALFRAEWHDGAVRFEPAAQLAGDDDEETLRAEMRTAAAAGQLWLADEGGAASSARRGARRAVVLGPLEVDQRAGNAPDFRITDRVVSAFMAARYGAAGRRLAPTPAEWNALRSMLSMCLVAGYADNAAAAPAPGSALPPNTPCLKLGNVTAQVRAASGSAAQVCVRHRLTGVVASGNAPVLATDDAPECTPIAAGDNAAEQPYLVASAGSALSVQNVMPEGRGRLFACQGASCTAVPTNGSVPLARGLVELREADNEAGAASPQALTLARVAVIDAQRDWFPVGLRRVEHGSAGEARAALERNGPWSAVARDARDVFAYTRRADRMQFRLVTSSALATVAEARPDLARPITREPPLVTRELPMAGAAADEPARPAQAGAAGEQPAAVAPRGSALVMLATSSPECPRGPAAQARRAMVDPDALLVDEGFFVFLAHDRGGDAPYRCLARATFRVRPWRTLAIEDSIVRFTLLSDLQLGVFLGGRAMSFSAAWGIVLPVGSLNLALVQQPASPLNLSLEVSPLALSIGQSFNQGDLFRAGVGSQISVFLGGGPVPRIATLGVMFHYPVVSTSVDGGDVVSGFVGVNLSEVLDLLGVR